MHNFNSERMGMAASCTAYARVCLDEAIAYAKERKTFGKPIAQHQVIRHKLVDMAQRVAASQAMLEMLAWRLGQGESPVAEICMMKNQATQTMAFCASEAVQIFGGAGFMRGIKVERIYREVKVNAIGGGTEEIMKDLASPADGVVTSPSFRGARSANPESRYCRSDRDSGFARFAAPRNDEGKQNAVHRRPRRSPPLTCKNSSPPRSILMSMNGRRPTSSRRTSCSRSSAISASSA